MIVNAAVDRTRAYVFQAVFDQHLRLTGDKTYFFPIDVTVAGSLIMELLRELHAALAFLDTPFTPVNDFIQPVGVIFGVVRFS